MGRSVPRQQTLFESCHVGFDRFDVPHRPGRESLAGPHAHCDLARRTFRIPGLFLRTGNLDAGCEWVHGAVRLIAREARTDIEVESPAQYVGDHWMAVGEGKYYGQYPPGLPAMLALVFRPFGWYWTLWVLPAMGTLSLLGLYLVVREWVGPGWPLVAAGLMAANPVANRHALGADSHTAVSFFLIWRSTV